MVLLSETSFQVLKKLLKMVPTIFSGKIYGVK